jgi:Domain of unknown function (DUF5122) beta-propeller
MTHTPPTATSPRMRLSAGLGSILLVFSAGAVHGQTLLTETTWGGVGADIATGVARAADGSAYLVGTTDSFAVDQFGNPAARGYIVKLLTNGTVAWQRIWNGPTIVGGADWSVAVAADGSVYLAGTTTSDNDVDAALVKFDSNGNLLWERTWGGVEVDGANAVATHTDGSVYIVGRTTSFPTGSAGLFVVKFDALGAVLWQKVWDGAASGEGAAVAPDGSVYAGGSIIRAPENLAEFDILALKLASTGTLTWARRYAAGEVVDVRGGMAAASDGSVYLAGALQAPGGGGIVGIAALIAKLDANGNLLFDKRCCTKSGDTGEGVTVGPDGSVHIAGTTTVLGAGNQDAFVIRLQPTGKKVTGAATWGTGTGFETGGGVAVAADGTIMLGATTTQPPPYSLLDATVKLSSARGTVTATASGLADVTGTVVNPVRGTTVPDGSTTFSGNFESALVRFTLP